MRIYYLTHDLHHNTGIGVFSAHFIRKIQELRPGWEISTITEESLSMNRWGLLKNFFKIRRYIKNCDIVHALDAFPYGLAAILCSLGLKKKIFITAIGSGAIRPLSGFFSLFLAKFVYRWADEFVAISNYTAGRIKEKIPGLDIKVVNLGVELNLFESQPADAELEKLVSDKKPYIFSDGSLKTRKGYEVSIPAFAEVLKEIPAFNYIIMHNKIEPGFFYGDKIRELIKKLNLENKVFFFEDPSDDLRRVLYRNAELFILMPQETPNDVEGFGLVFLQAAACGLPVIGSRGSAVEDAMVNNGNGFLVEPKDTGAIAGAVIKILSNFKLKRKFSEESKKFARCMLWSRVAEEYIKLYESTGV